MTNSFLKPPFAGVVAAMTPIVVSIVVAFGATADAQDSGSPRLLSSGTNTGEMIARSTTADTETRWEFRTKSNVIVSTTIVRLRDVVTPLDPSMPSWPRLEGMIIGLVPVTSDEMVIERNRLANALRRAQASPLPIDLIGPAKIKIRYSDAGRPSQVNQRASTFAPGPQVTALGRVQPSVTQAVPTSMLAERQAKTVVSWIERGIERQHPTIDRAFVSAIDLRQAELVPLESMKGEPYVEFEREPAEGNCQILVRGQSVNGPCESMVTIRLKANPTVVVPSGRFPRGYRLRYEDLTTMPILAEKMDTSLVTDPSELVGMEVRRGVSPGRPILRTDVGAPILVRRGDLVEIRVIGGGVTITTNGKALEDGAESDTIEVEKFEPRKKMLASVVQSGLVEVLSRTRRVGQ